MKAMATVVILVALPCFGWAQVFAWGKFLQHYTVFNSVAVDRDGNVIVAGGFQESITFENQLLHSGRGDGLMTKYDSVGKLIWFRRMGSIGKGGGGFSRVLTDQFDNIYALAYFSDSAKIGGTLYIDKTPDLWTVALIKYDQDGEYLWSETFPNTGDTNLALDHSGNVYVVGSDIGDPTVTPVSWIAKYDSSGNQLLHTSLTTPTTTSALFAYQLAVDADENIYLFGYAAANFTVGTIPVEADPSGESVLIKLNREGIAQWVRLVRYFNFNRGGIAVDGDGNIFVASSLNDKLGFDRYDPGGELIWSKTFDNIRVQVMQTRLTEDGGAVIAAWYYGIPIVSLDGIILPAQGQGVLVGAIDRDGSFQWIVAGQHEQLDYVFDMATNRNTGDIYIAGIIQSDRVRFGDIEFVSSMYNRSAFLLKIGNVPGMSPTVLDLGDDVGLCPGNELPVALSGFARYRWQDGSTDSTFVITEPGKYYVSVIDKAGYLLSDTIIVSKCFEATIPNVITPNGDGDNDFFEIETLNLTLKNKLRIVDRWGKLVYSSADYRNNWDGAGLHAGVYYYELFNATNRKRYRGWLQILR